jgi:hypothetical protein
MVLQIIFKTYPRSYDPQIFWRNRGIYKCERKNYYAPLITESASFQRMASGEQIQSKGN